ncbi:serine aminopeptidase domain-containing protein [Cetobacterium sp.]|uniref:serine aminopeptidase domain-containing protein n=1 Tax=Cetobacterium sp. TaxID=2071632 RepID=UPI003F36F410
MIKIEIIYPKGETPLAIVQIIHGMGEHSKRYLDFVKFLNKNKIAVALSNHRAHGLHAYENNKLGKFSKSFKVLVFDQIEISKQIKKFYPKIPLFILGHSMGSFIAQGHMKISSKIIEGYIFMGSCYQDRFLVKSGKVLFKTISLFSKNPRKIFNNIFFLGANSKIKDTNKNNFSWLSTDSKVVQNFIEDPLCGFPYTPIFYYNFLDFLSNLHRKNNFDFVKKNIPIFLISGLEDPIGLYGKGVKELYNFYRNLGFTKLSLKLYKNFRHEILNEINKEKVYEDILQWILTNKKS